jgi:predicted Ser/Thr protein kinase
MSKFEEWIDSEAKKPGIIDYESARKGWQAALRHAAKLCKRERVSKKSERENEGDAGYNAAIRHCVEAIERDGKA